MKALESKYPHAGKISLEPGSKKTIVQKMCGLDITAKEVGPDNLKTCNSNLLLPQATSTLRFSIDAGTHEELISSGLQVRIVKQHKIRSYMNIQRKAIAAARRFFSTLPDHSEWVKDELSTLGVDSFFYKHSCYLLEISVNSKAVLESNLRHLQKDYSMIKSANEGETLGFVTFNENTKDKDWLDVHGLYILPKYQKLGLGTFLVRAVAGVGLLNNKRGVEFNDPFFWGNSGFYKHRGMDLIRGRTSRHRFGCAQLKLLNDDGSLATLHQLLPESSKYPLEFKKLKGPDCMGLL